MERLVSLTEAAGAKLVLVGDPEQLQAIEAGRRSAQLPSAWGRLRSAACGGSGRSGSARRHGSLPPGRVKRRLGATSKQALSRWPRRARARAALVEAWDRDRLADPALSQLILAPTRADVHALNLLAREAVRESGALGRMWCGDRARRAEFCRRGSRDVPAQ